jgi:hypothetical protein
MCQKFRRNDLPYAAKLITNFHSTSNKKWYGSAIAAV